MSICHGSVLHDLDITYLCMKQSLYMEMKQTMLNRDQEKNTIFKTENMSFIDWFV